MTFEKLTLLAFIIERCRVFVNYFVRYALWWKWGKGGEKYAALGSNYAHRKLVLAFCRTELGSPHVIPDCHRCVLSRNGNALLARTTMGHADSALRPVGITEPIFSILSLVRPSYSRLRRARWAGMLWGLSCTALAGRTGSIRHASEIIRAHEFHLDQGCPRT